MKGFKKKAKREFLACFACMLVLFQLVSMTALPTITVGAEGIETNENVTINLSIASNSTGIIQKNENFELEIELKNNADDDIENLSLYISEVEGLVPAASNWIIDTGESVAKGDKYTKKINMNYKGSEDSISLSVVAKFKKGNEEQKSKIGSMFVVVNSETPSDPGPSNPSQYKPELKIKPGIQMPVVNAGQDVSLTFPIYNASTTQAKDITVSINTDDAKTLPFTFNQVNLTKVLNDLSSNKEEKVTFNVKMKSDVLSGIYPIKLNYQFSNSRREISNTNETIYIKVVNDKTPPKLTLERFSVFCNDGEKPLPGSMASLTLNLKNQGDYAAKDVKVTLKGLSNEGIYVSKSADTKYVGEIEGQKAQDIEYFINVSDKFKGNNVSLSANVEYKDNTGKVYNEEFQFFVKVQEVEEEQEKDDTSPELTLKNLVFPKETINVGEDFNVSFSLDNIGFDIARNVKVTVTCEEGILPISTNTVFTEIIDIGETKDYSFDLYANKTAVTKNHLITINVEYENKIDNVKYNKTVGNNNNNDDSDDSDDDNNNNNKPNGNDNDKTPGKDDNKLVNVMEKLTISRYAGVYVENNEKKDEDEEKTKPQIIINKYNFEPEEAHAGQNFKLKLSFLNTSKILPIRNIKITFSAKEGIFIPTNSSNTFFIENLDMQENADREVELFTKADAPAKSHILNLNFEYEDEKGTQYTAAEEISIPVKQEQRLSMGQLNIPTDTMEGEPIPIFMDFFNMGKSTLYNLMVSIESEGLKSDNGNFYVGNFESGRGDYFESMVTPTMTGEVTGNILFSYEDESGNKNELRKEIKLNVNKMEMPEMPPEGEMAGGEFPGGENPGGEQPKKLFTPLNIGIGVGGLLLIAVVIIVIIKKRRSRKAGMMLDE